MGGERRGDKGEGGKAGGDVNGRRTCTTREIKRFGVLARVLYYIASTAPRPARPNGERTINHFIIVINDPGAAGLRFRAIKPEQHLNSRTAAAAAATTTTPYIYIYISIIYLAVYDPPIFIYFFFVLVLSLWHASVFRSLSLSVFFFFLFNLHIYIPRRSRCCFSVFFFFFSASSFYFT